MVRRGGLPPMALAASLVLLATSWSSYRSSASATGPASQGITLLDVEAISADDAWAVGYSGMHPEDGPIGQAIAMHWDGSNWSRVAIPRPGTATWFESVTATAHDDVWASGIFRTSDGRWKGLVEHWDGVAWSVALRDARGNEFSAIDASDDTHVWAVSRGRMFAGQGDFAQWDGSSWETSAPPDTGFLSSFTSVLAVSSYNVWAVGFRKSGNRTLIEHWDGARWAVVPSPNPTKHANSLYAVDGSSAGDVWAVGLQGGEDLRGGGSLAPAAEAPTKQRGLSVHWNGSSWTSVETAESGEAALLGAVTVRADDVWAVGLRGSYYVDPSPLIEHWDGTAWRVVSGAGDLGQGILRSASASSSDDVWAVGNTIAQDGEHHALIEHWNGDAWSVVN